MGSDSECANCHRGLIARRSKAEPYTDSTEVLIGDVPFCGLCFDVLCEQLPKEEEGSKR